MVCKQCGNPMPDNAHVCPSCGAKRVASVKEDTAYPEKTDKQPAQKTDKQPAQPSGNQGMIPIRTVLLVAGIITGVTVIAAIVLVVLFVVKRDIPVQQVRLNHSSLTLMAGDSFQLVPQFQPADATNQEVLWASSDEGVATVLNGVVIAKAAGNTTITARTAEGNRIDICSVTVNGQFALTFDANGGSVSENERILINGNPYGTLPVPTRDYYEFLGWFSSPSGGERVTSKTVMGMDAATVYAQWSLKPFSDAWSAWSSEYIEADDFTKVESRTLYEYPVYRIVVYGRTYTQWTMDVLLLAVQDGASDYIAGMIKKVLLDQDPFHLGRTFEENPIQFTIENTVALSHLDDRIYLEEDKRSYANAEPTERNGEKILYREIKTNGAQWLMDIQHATVKTEYRYVKRER